MPPLPVERLKQSPYCICKGRMSISVIFVFNCSNNHALFAFSLFKVLTIKWSCGMGSIAENGGKKKKISENVCEAVERWPHANDIASNIYTLTGKTDETLGASWLKKESWGPKTAKKLVFFPIAQCSSSKRDEMVRNSVFLCTRRKNQATAQARLEKQAK